MSQKPTVHTPSPKASKQKVRINILSENAAYNIIGFILIKQIDDESLTLFNIRECIKSQFDKEQLEAIGGETGETFKFMLKSIPISKKQEKLITVDEITVSDTKQLIQHKSDIFDDDDGNDGDDDTNLRNTPYERVPHHFQYIGFSSPTHLEVPSSKSSMDHNHKKHRKKSSSLHNKLSPFQLPQNTVLSSSLSLQDTHYSVIVRIDTMRHSSFRKLPQTKLNGNTSMSVFDGYQSIQSDIDNHNERHDGGSETEISASTSIENEFNDNNNTTRLEEKLGTKLPKIRDSKSMLSTVQMTNILHDALVKDPLNPMKSLRSLHSLHSLNNNNIETDDETDDDDNDDDDDEDDISQDIAELIDGLKDDNCRFTVIAHNQTLIFYDATELILGLQCVHHSKEAPIWMHLACDTETFSMLSEHIKPSIHTLTIEDCTSECREKLEVFDDYLFICIHASITEKLCIIVFKTMVITFHDIQNMNTNVNMTDFIISEARNRLEKRHKMQCPSPGWIVHSIIDVIVDRMIPEIECSVQEVQNMENLIFALSGTSQHELLQRLQIARNRLIFYQSRLWPKSTMTHNLSSDIGWRHFLVGVQGQYWNDINDHVARMVDLLNIGQSTLESCQNIFVAKISLETAEQSNELSDNASRLTAVGSIFLPLTFFCGLWGMNCKVPFQYQGDHAAYDDYYGFCIVFILMLTAAGVTYKYHMTLSNN